MGARHATMAAHPTWTHCKEGYDHRRRALLSRGHGSKPRRFVQIYRIRAPLRRISGARAVVLNVGGKSMDDVLGDLEFRTLLWDESAQSWREVQWAPNIGRSIPGAPAGDQRLVVCVMQDGYLYNIIPHRYIIENSENIVRSVDGLSDEQSDEYSILYKKLKPTKNDDRRIALLREIIESHLSIPFKLRASLVKSLPGPPADDPNCGIKALLAEYGAHAGTSTKQ
jgi:hypothetical protein